MEIKTKCVFCSGRNIDCQYCGNLKSKPTPKPIKLSNSPIDDYCDPAPPDLSKIRTLFNHHMMPIINFGEFDTVGKKWLKLQIEILEVEKTIIIKVDQNQIVFLDSETNQVIEW